MGKVDGNAGPSGSLQSNHLKMIRCAGVSLLNSCFLEPLCDCLQYKYLKILSFAQACHFAGGTFGEVLAAELARYRTVTHTSPL